MSAADPATNTEFSSNRPGSSPSPRLVRGARLRLFWALAGAAGAVALAVAAVTPVVVLQVLGASGSAEGVDTRLTGLERHGPALVVLAAFGALMVVAALRGSRAAAGAVAACGLAALAIAILADVPDLDARGRVGPRLSEADAGPGAGFTAETLGGVLLLVAGVGGLVLAPRPVGTRRYEAGTNTK